MYGSATPCMWIAVITRVCAAERFEGVLQGQGVDHRGQHAHVMGGRFLNAGVGVLELRAAEDVAAADHEADLAAAIGRLLDLPGDVRHFLHADAALAGMAEAFARELQDDAADSVGLSVIRPCQRAWFNRSEFQV